MGRLSARSNPTGLVELNKTSVTISVLEVGGKRSFSIDKLDLAGVSAVGELEAVAVARAGNSSARFELGSVHALAGKQLPLHELDPSQPLRFRLLLKQKGASKLTATAENLRPRNDQQAESLLPMEAADLGERLWRVDVSDGGPILLFNSKVFPSAAGAENYLPFVAMVLPEALRSVMAYISRQPECLEDDSGSWAVWAGWLLAMGVELPPEEDDDTIRREWCEDVVDRFCDRFSFATRLAADLVKEMGND